MNLPEEVNLDQVQIIVHIFLLFLHFLRVVVFKTILLVLEVGEIKTETLLKVNEGNLLVAFV